MNLDFNQDGDFAFTGLTQHSQNSPALVDILTAQQSSAKKRVGWVTYESCSRSQLITTQSFDVMAAGE